MGGSSYSSDVYRTISSVNASKPMDDVFTKRSIANDMSPKGLKFREARDSDAHPESLPIIVALDETGSMGQIPYELTTGKMGTLVETMLDHKVEHPAILFIGVGDHISDFHPLQVGQFESGAIELNHWLTNVYLEGNGGGQTMESYHLAWLVAGRHTSTDHFEKRGKKGYLFTIGDEYVHDGIKANQLKEMMGYTEAEDVTREQLLAEAQRMYEVFHIHINDASHRDNKMVFEGWKKLLGERFLVLENHDDVAELIATTVSIMEGAKLADVIAGFDPATANAVSKALATVNPTIMPTNTKGAMSL